MNYAKVSDDVLIQYPYTMLDLKEENPFTRYDGRYSLPEWYAQTEDAIKNNRSLVSVNITNQPTYNHLTENCVEIDPSMEYGKWVQKWEITNATPDKVAQRQEQAKESNKQQASYMLTETDWVEIPSVSDIANTPHLVNYADFITYRLALRTIAVNPPVTVQEWPVKPDEIWSA